jgi:hypothetical protein
MSQFIEHVVEPDTLLLAWQAPDHMKNRRRWLVARVNVSNAEWTLTYLRERDFEQANSGASYDEVRKLGYEGYPAFALSEQHHPKSVRAALMRRVPPRTRPDFPVYLAQFGFSGDADVSDAVLLAYTGGKLPSDGFSFAPELQIAMAVGDLIFDLAGTRYYVNESCSVRVGDPLSFRREPENTFDRDAIEVLCRDYRIGYINRLQARAFSYWMDHRSVEASIQRLNGRPGEPKVYAFVRVRPRKEPLAA